VFLPSFPFVQTALWGVISPDMEITLTNGLEGAANIIAKFKE
jgi:hypothetical protein